jgi:hypothetical protein
LLFEETLSPAATVKHVTAIAAAIVEAVFIFIRLLSNALRQARRTPEQR